MGKKSRTQLPFGVFVAFWTVTILAIDLSFAKAWIRQARTGRFVPTPAMITRSETVGSGRRSHTIIEYEYEAADGRHTSNTVRFGTIAGGAELSRYPVGAKVVAYVDPEQSERAVLRTGYEPIDVEAALFLVPFNSVALILVYAGPVGWINARRWRSLNPTQARSSDDRLSDVVSSPSRLTRAMFVASLFCFAGVLVGVFTGLFASWGGAGAIVAIIILAGAAAAMAPVPRRLNRDNDFSIDQKNRQLLLPPRPAGVLGRAKLRLDEIQEIIVVPLRDETPLKRQVFDVVIAIKTGQRVAVDRFTTAERAQGTVAQIKQLVSSAM